jgi:hypothetical protein
MAGSARLFLNVLKNSLLKISDPSFYIMLGAWIGETVALKEVQSKPADAEGEAGEE